jgi:hypothetical protein
LKASGAAGAFQGGDVMRTLMVSVSFAVPFALTVFAQPVERQSLDVFAQVGLTAREIASIDEGRPVAKVLSWGESSEIFVFGAVHVNGTPAAYLQRSRDIKRLAGTPGYLGIGEIPAAATAADLVGVTLDADDIKALKKCREGSCDVQLPTTAIRAFQNAVDWSQPDPSAQVNSLARDMLLGLVREYRRGGNAALGVYRDKEHPARVAAQFETMVGRAAAIPDVIPELRRYLLQYPNQDLPGADSYFYWEKVDFGMKPTIRVNHAVVYHTRAGQHDISAVAIKQLYASHYFHTALDVSACISDSTKSESRGFYLLTLKGSEQEGLTGFKGSVVRRVVVDKTRSSLESALASIKQAIEKTPAGAQR